LIPSLYLVTDRSASSRPLPQLVAEAISRVDPRRVAVQLREKDLSARALFEVGREVLAACRARGVPMLVNDRLDVAFALSADGVHLGGDAIPAAKARELWPQARIGISCHSPEELSQRRKGADFATWGPVFFTPSKARYGPPVGFEGFAAARAIGLPLVALGGIDPESAGGLKQKGFAGIACVRAVFSAQNPAQAAQDLLAAYDRV
jgi:thiamine-phosphate pyrophosphorylase